MATQRDTTYGYPPAAFEPSTIPDIDRDFLRPGELEAFEAALQAPDIHHGHGDEISSPRSPRSPGLTKRNSQTGVDEYDEATVVAAEAAAHSGQLSLPISPSPTPAQGTFITAQNDWAPVNPRLYASTRAGKKKKRRTKRAVEGLLGTRTQDETREGYLYQLSKWPLLIFVFGWLLGLAVAYLSTRLYIWIYEHFVTWRGRRENHRRTLRRAGTYKDWVSAARELDGFLGRKAWREENEFAYYDSKTVKRVWEQMKKTRALAETSEKPGAKDGQSQAVYELRALAEACTKNNFVGIENPRLYSQTYYGTKNLVQNFIDEGKSAISLGTI